MTQPLAPNAPAPCLGGASGGCAGTLRVHVSGHAKAVEPWQTLTPAGTATGPLAPEEWLVRLTNVAQGATADVVRLLHVEVTSPDAGQPWSCQAAGSEAACESLPSRWPQLAPAQLVGKLGGSVPEVQFRVRLSPKQDVAHKAKVCVLADGDPALKAAEFCFWVARAPSPPAIDVQPAEVLFSASAKTAQSQPIVVRNIGGSMLKVHGIHLALPGTYSLTHAGGEITGKEYAEFDLGLQIPPGGIWKALLSRIGGAGPDPGGVLRIYSNAVNVKGYAQVQVKAPLHVQCLKLLPSGVVDFGAVVPGQQTLTYVVLIKNCGELPVAWTQVQLDQDPTGSGVFGIDWNQSTVANGATPVGPSPQAPLVVHAGGQAALALTYDSTALHPQFHTANLIITAGSETYGLPLRAENVSTTCPIAKVTVAEGEQVVPQTTIHLKGDKSSVAGGTIKKYKWMVKQPAGSNQPLTPNASFANPSLLANAAGEYEFCLEVWDANGSKSCVPACQKVLVIPNNALHIELVWDTPSDPNQTDSGPAAGADLDLHFAHPVAQMYDLDCDGQADPWFSNPWDAFWFNAAPEWGAAGNTKDNPTINLDDTDGMGPENLNLIDPEGTLDNPVAYHVGVHYWNDHGYGTSFATLSIYVQGGLSMQFTKVKMDPLDMWYVGRFHWPNFASGGTKNVFDTCYQSGNSCQAKQNLMWQPKGDWCMTPCYENKTWSLRSSQAAGMPIGSAVSRSGASRERCFAEPKDRLPRTAPANCPPIVQTLDIARFFRRRPNTRVAATSRPLPGTAGGGQCAAFPPSVQARPRPDRVRDFNLHRLHRSPRRQSPVRLPQPPRNTYACPSPPRRPLSWRVEVACCLFPAPVPFAPRCAQLPPWSQPRPSPRCPLRPRSTGW
ncbi:MAG: hypothetical protein FJ100_07105 [Deltaproteobacteria bacterium]|nr:hypothetical protein [Deltaproteobacteria bacterium]